jgi:hypothetical protein
MKGGFFGLFGSDSTGSSWSSWNPFKKSTPQPLVIQSQPIQQQPIQQQPMQQVLYPPVGGKYKSTRRYMKGGFTSNAPQMNVAGYAAPISGVPNAQPQAWVGGPEYKGGKRTRRRNKRHNKSYRKH